MEAPTTIKEIWPGIALIISVRSSGTREGRAFNEIRYYVSSLLQHVRDRWSMENSLHWVTGTQLRENARRYRERNGVPSVLAITGWLPYPRSEGHPGGGRKPSCGCMRRPGIGARGRHKGLVFLATVSWIPSISPPRCQLPQKARWPTWRS
jgi:hypothetical protein